MAKQTKKKVARKIAKAAVRKPVKPAKKAKAPAKSAKAAKPAKAKKPTKAAKPAKPTKAAKSSAKNATVIFLENNNHKGERRLDAFTKAQKDRLLQLRDAMVDSMAGVAKDNLRSRAEGSEASAFGMHQADAGSDAYDRDFALSLLSQEQDALYEIDQALKRIELGTYGKCEMSTKSIPRARLEAIPFARFTVECQSQLEKQNKQSRIRQSVTSLFGLTDDDSAEGEEEEAAPAAEKE
ncbi:MAG: TraR/DksA family transcriptional regulator [Verrucomicrobiota bacterium]|nr:TraR/DksA family transcriptional regulator [Verrucomicrobiota bacterium]